MSLIESSPIEGFFLHLHEFFKTNYMLSSVLNDSCNYLRWMSMSGRTLIITPVINCESYYSALKFNSGAQMSSGSYWIGEENCKHLWQSSLYFFVSPRGSRAYEEALRFIVYILIFRHLSFRFPPKTISLSFLFKSSRFFTNDSSKLWTRKCSCLFWKFNNKFLFTSCLSILYDSEPLNQHVFILFC